MRNGDFSGSISFSTFFTASDRLSSVSSSDYSSEVIYNNSKCTVQLYFSVIRYIFRLYVLKHEKKKVIKTGSNIVLFNNSPLSCALALLWSIFFSFSQCFHSFCLAAHFVSYL
jgi:hypothetical protein